MFNSLLGGDGTKSPRTFERVFRETALVCGLMRRTTHRLEASIGESLPATRDLRLCPQSPTRTAPAAPRLPLAMRPRPAALGSPHRAHLRGAWPQPHRHRGVRAHRCPSPSSTRGRIDLAEDDRLLVQDVGVHRHPQPAPSSSTKTPRRLSTVGPASAPRRRSSPLRWSRGCAIAGSRMRRATQVTSAEPGAAMAHRFTARRRGKILGRFD